MVSMLSTSTAVVSAAEIFLFIQKEKALPAIVISHFHSSSLPHHTAWMDVENMYQGPGRDPRFAMDAKPRKKGGLSTTYNLDERLEEKLKKSNSFKAGDFSGRPSVPVMNAEEKFGEAQNQMEHGLYKKAAFSFLDAYELAEEEQRAAQRKGKVSKKKQVDIRVASKMAMHNRFAAKNERQWTVQDESSWNLRQG